jgi:15-cis-phytoene synthase
MTLSTDQAIAVLKSHGRSFHFASRLLGQTYRIRAARLYAFCRYVDDLADESCDPAIAAQELLALKASLQTGKTNEPCVASMIDLMQELSMPLAPVLSLVNGVQSDLEPRRIQDQAELLQYAYQVAGTVGLMMCIILDVRDRQAWPFAIDLGIAMQLTNIARDVGEDAHKGRLYLPAEWLGGISAAQIPKPSAEHAAQLRDATQQVLSLAQTYYQSGLDGIHYLPTTARYGIVVAAMVYREIGQMVTDNDYRSWDSRAIVPYSRKLATAAKALTRHSLQSSSRQKHVHHDAHLHQHLQHCFGANASAPA